MIMLLLRFILGFILTPCGNICIVGIAITIDSVLLHFLFSCPIYYPCTSLALPPSSSSCGSMCFVDTAITIDNVLLLHVFNTLLQ